MSRWPLLFTFQQKVYGNGFLANVVAHGSVLASQEEEGVWMDGVQPADLSAGGEDIYDAYLKFRKNFNEILEDIAEDPAFFNEFKEEVHRFFERKDEEVLSQWLEAVEEVGAGNIELDKIPKKNADSARYVEVTMVEDFRDNQVVLEKDTDYAVAA